MSCPDCNDTGRYVGFTESYPCSSCAKPRGDGLTDDTAAIQRLLAVPKPRPARERYETLVEELQQARKARAKLRAQVAEYEAQEQWLGRGNR